jgi:hypothetical protein
MQILSWEKTIVLQNKEQHSGKQCSFTQNLYPKNYLGNENQAVSKKLRKNVNN